MHAPADRRPLNESEGARNSRSKQSPETSRSEGGHGPRTHVYAESSTKRKAARGGAMKQLAQATQRAASRSVRELGA